MTFRRIQLLVAARLSLCRCRAEVIRLSIRGVKKRFAATDSVAFRSQSGTRAKRCTVPTGTPAVLLVRPNSP